MRYPDRQTFVLVHGAWHGGWCWVDVAELLRRRGHTVTTPTQTGLGERKHLLSKGVNFKTFVEDIENHLSFENLQNVVLVGHSFGASVVAAVADRNRERLRRLIFLDGFLPQSGRSMLDQRTEQVAKERLRLAEETSGGITVPVPDVGAFGLVDEEQRLRVASRLTPHPLRTFLSKVRLRAPLGNGLPWDYIACTEPRYAGTEWSIDAARRLKWSLHNMKCGHDAMIQAPVATADLLERIASTVQP
jgi:pimeloyl-ACP methyl ester carboxylesterase